MALPTTRSFLAVLLGKQSFVGALWGKQEFDSRLPSMFDQFHHYTPADKVRRRKHLANRITFNVFVGAMASIHVVLQGIELDTTAGNTLEERAGFFAMDVLFTSFFFGEMLLRQNQIGWQYFLIPWNTFDFGVVVLSCLDIVVSVTHANALTTKIAPLLRVCRVLRVSGYFAGMQAFQGMWLVISGITGSVVALFWTFLLLCIVIYVIAVAFCSFVTSDPYAMDHWEELNVYGGTILRAALTIFQVSTFENVALLRPLIDWSPVGLAILAPKPVRNGVELFPSPACRRSRESRRWCELFSMVVINFGILNVIVATMVERLTELKTQQEQANGKRLKSVEASLLMMLGDDFRTYDANHNGQLELQEFQKMVQNHNVSLKLRLLGVQMDEAELIFELLDADRSGALSPEEFVDGIQRLRGTARSQDVVGLISFARLQCKMAMSNIDRTRRLQETVDILQQRLDSCGRSLAGECHQRAGCARSRSDVWEKAVAWEKAVGDMDKERGRTFPTLPE